MFYKFDNIQNPKVDWQFIYKKEFNDEFCDLLLNSCEDDKWVAARVGGDPGKPGGMLDTEIRSVSHQSSKMGEYKGMQSFPYHHIADKIMRANSEIWRLDLTGFNMETDQPNILRYREKEAGHYNWHLDIGAEFSNRKLTCIIQLSDPKDYDGCDVEILGAPTGEKKLKERGTVIMFPSYVQHRVTKITRGTRYCWVGWVHGPHFR
tara:strand:- start:276 stop:893 length:618 start_codon:yes stop_codon:yes gene_type:complete